MFIRYKIFRKRGLSPIKPRTEYDGREVMIIVGSFKKLFLKVQKSTAKNLKFRHNLKLNVFCRSLLILKYAEILSLMNIIKKQFFFHISSFRVKIKFKVLRFFWNLLKNIKVLQSYKAHYQPEEEYNMEGGGVKIIDRYTIKKLMMFTYIITEPFTILDSSRIENIIHSNHCHILLSLI